MKSRFSRRRFVAGAAALGMELTVGRASAAEEKPALLGGRPVRRGGFSSWPVRDQREDKAILDVVHGGHWNRGPVVNRFEKEYANATGSRFCVATSSGTSALFCSLGALGVGPGDEVIVPPYTFFATVDVVLLNYAMPVFVDSDPQTFQMDPRKLEAAITDRTAAIIPVHIGGSAADLDSILAIAKKRHLPVIEDACQAHLGEWRGRKLGTWGMTGCFSFQVSKNLCSGEGGAILAQQEEVAHRCAAFHNVRRSHLAGANFAYNGGRATNMRMTEFQGAVLLSQMTRIEAYAKIRDANARYLTDLLRQIPGIVPAQMYEGCTRNAYHLYMFRYQPEHFAKLPRSRFLQAMSAEGIPCSSGYGPLNKASYIRDTLRLRGYTRVYGKAEIERWDERNRCPENDKLCEEAVWFTQNMLLGPRTDMDQIAEAVRKIRASASQLAKT